jgi:hypothetical protein
VDNKCSQRTLLQTEANGVLEKLVKLTKAQLEAFNAQRQDEFMRLDKELETTIGAKERVIGAVRQHIKEHGCQQ